MTWTGADGQVTGTYEEWYWYWVYSYFTWMVPAEPDLPDNTAVAEILAGIGATSAPLTVTLLWNAPVDLDLHFSCDDGSEISYEHLTQEACGGSLDKDMVADGYNAVRGDGSLGQVENISVGNAVAGAEYYGRVHYYSGEGNAEFQAIFSGVDAEGHLHVYGQEHVADFAVSQAWHDFHFTYADPDAEGGK